MPVPLSIVAAVFAAAITQPATPTGDERELIVANADGSWTITRDIHEAPVSIARLTNGVLEDDESAENYALDSERERMREQENDDQVERAFEEAIDAVKSAGPNPLN